MILTLEGDAPAALAILGGTPTCYRTIRMSASTRPRYRSLATTDVGDPIEGERLAGIVGAGRGVGSGLVDGRRFPVACPRERRQPARQAAGRDPSARTGACPMGGSGKVHRAQVLIDLASVYGAVGEPVKARTAVREAREIVDGIANAGALPVRLAAVEKRLRVGATRNLPDSDVPSEAEVRVLRLLAAPLSAREIAGELYVSINTVKTHTKALHQKLGTASREETVGRPGKLGFL